MPNQTVHIGHWTDWSAASPASRLILTLESRSGALLNNALLLLITLVGSRFWFIVSFLIHRFGNHQERRDGLRRSIEVILRNQSAMGALAGISKAVSAWGNHVASARSYLIGIFVLILVLLNIFGWAAAGLAEALIILGPVVQASSAQCGHWIPPLDSEAVAQTWVVDLAQAAQLHLATCTGPNARPNCGRLVSPTINLDLTHNASCPFGDNLCWDGPTGALNIDTGEISSVDLGFNLPKPFTVRHTMQCSPLNAFDDVHTRLYNMSWPIYASGTYESLYLYYGGLAGSSPLADPDGNVATYQYSNAFSVYQKGYVLESASWSNYDTAEPNTLRWNPIPALLSPPSDTSIYFLSAGTLVYNTPSSDPWFLTNADGPIYVARKFVSPLACHEQRQFCNPSNGKCSTPSTSRTLPNSTDLGWDDLQEDALRVLDWITFPLFPISYLVDSRGALLLLANQKSYNGGTASVAAEQWKLEVANWMNIAITGVKLAVVNFGTGQANPGPGYQRILGDSEVCKRRMVKFRADGGEYTSYNLAGILIIILVGLLIIGISLLIEPFFAMLVKNSTGKFGVKYEAWRRDELLELYSSMMKSFGIGPWSAGKWDVPVTPHGVLMAETRVVMPPGRHGPPISLYEAKQSQGPQNGQIHERVYHYRNGPV